MKACARSRTVAFTIIFALAVIFPTALPAAADAEGGASPSDTGVFSEEVGISIVEVNDEYRQLATELLGDRFVEAWLTHEQDHFVVGVYNLNADTDAAVLAQLQTIAATELVNRQFARAEVEEVANAVKNAMTDEVDRYTLTVNYERGTVEVGLPPDASLDSLANELGSAVGVPVLSGDDATNATSLFDFEIAGDDPMIVLIQQDSPQPAEDLYGTPLRAGKSLWITGGNWCSSGFQVHSASNAQYVLTAGHCGPSGNPVHIANYPNYVYYTPPVGNLQNNTVWNVSASANLTADGAIFPASSSYLPSTPSVYVNSSLQRSVVAQTTAVSPYTRVCQMGMITVTEACGYVESASTGYFFTSSDNILHNFSGSIKWQWDSGTSGVSGGDSGGPVYAVNPDGTAIAIGVTSAYLTEERRSWASPIASVLSQTGTILSTTGRQPFGWIDGAAGGAGQVTVSGWVIDPDLAQISTSVHIYIGGPAGSGAPSYALSANIARSDVANTYPNTGNTHGFYGTITTSVRGSSVPVYAYGIDIGGSAAGSPVLSGSPLYVSIS
ncbi:MAG: S1 family peptidase [Bifidobacteriaceae bacterium]|jgi:hypothetical protein|nr:S1 family peptidase [Bifidobacteriaceae bacterium]